MNCRGRFCFEISPVAKLSQVFLCNGPGASNVVGNEWRSVSLLLLLLLCSIANVPFVQLLKFEMAAAAKASPLLSKRSSISHLRALAVCRRRRHKKYSFIHSNVHIFCICCELPQVSVMHEQSYFCALYLSFI